MQIVITLDGKLARRVVLGGAAAVAAAVLLVPAITRAAVPNTFTAGTPISAAQMNANFNSVDARITALENLLAGASRSGATIVLAGVNLQIKNGQAATNTTDGTGNLIIGHNEDTATVDTRTGSHNLVIGADHGWTSYGGVLAGSQHVVSAPGGVCLGGTQNRVAGESAVVVGGSGNAIVTNGIPGEEGRFATTVGSFNESNEFDMDGRYSCNLGPAGVSFGNNTFQTDLGSGSFITNVGNFGANLNLGFMANGNVNLGVNGGANVNIATQAGTLSIGQQVPSPINFGFNSGGVNLGNGATNVTVGQQAGSVDVGQGLVMNPAGGGMGTRVCNVGLNTDAVNLGQGARNVTVAFQAGGVGVAENLNVNPAAGGMGSGVATLGINSPNGVVVGLGATRVDVGFAAGDVTLGDNLTATPASGGTGMRQCSIATNGANNVFIGANATGSVQLGVGAASVQVGP